MKILITGDLVINGEYPTDKISKDVINLFAKSDFNIVNLEAPVTTSDSKIIKTGPHLRSNKESTNQVLKCLKINLVTLANNHILDYDQQGLLDTLSFCQINNIKTVGAGKNLEEASHTLYFDTGEGKIAVINFAENEWASATEETAGASPMDIIDNAAQIKEAKSKANYVIVIIHGGHEYYNLPSPRMQKQYRFYAECGANLVVGHHTHCISGDEIYNGVPIYYSLGNFLFTKQNKNNEWYNGLILEVDISKGRLSSCIHPVSQQKENFNLILSKGKEKEDVLRSIEAFREIIQEKGKLDKEWDKYIKRQDTMYLNYWSPLSFVNNRHIRVALRKIGGNLMNPRGLSLYLNLIQCEAHRDLSKEVLRKRLTK